jgi:Flp pilus assembly pilin Flp
MGGSSAQGRRLNRERKSVEKKPEGILKELLLDERGMETVEFAVIAGLLTFVVLVISRATTAEDYAIMTGLSAVAGFIALGATRSQRERDDGP